MHCVSTITVVREFNRGDALQCVSTIIDIHKFQRRDAMHCVSTNNAIHKKRQRRINFRMIIIAKSIKSEKHNTFSEKFINFVGKEKENTQLAFWV